MSGLSSCLFDISPCESFTLTRLVIRFISIIVKIIIYLLFIYLFIFCFFPTPMFAVDIRLRNFVKTALLINLSFEGYIQRRRLIFPFPFKGCKNVT